MARLGRRERHEKRQRLETLERLQLIRKEEVAAEQKQNRSLPARELAWLKGQLRVGGSICFSLDPKNLKGKTHYAGAYVGRSPGSGPLENKPMPPRFAQGFMASGHEGNTITDTADDRSFRKVGYVTVNGRKTKRVIWREIGKS